MHAKALRESRFPILPVAKISENKRFSDTQTDYLRNGIYL